jgi:hypothetical protein
MAIRTLCAFFLFAATPSSSEAQRLHQGFWIGFAPGGVGATRAQGFAYPLYLRFGGTISQRVMVGIESFALFDAGPAMSSGNITVLALLYPSARGGFLVKTAVGLARANAQCPDSPDDSQDGVGGTFGLGYDIRLATNTYLTPNIDLLVRTNKRPLCPIRAPPGGGPGPEAGTVRDYSPGYAFTLGLTWH